MSAGSETRDRYCNSHLDRRVGSHGSQSEIMWSSMRMWDASSDSQEHTWDMMRSARKRLWANCGGCAEIRPPLSSCCSLQTYHNAISEKNGAMLKVSTNSLERANAAATACVMSLRKGVPSSVGFVSLGYLV